MANFLENPEQFKAELKDKWLDYYQANRSWIKTLMDISGSWCDSVSSYEDEELEKFGYDSNYSPRRPDSRFIFGVLNVIEPQIKGLFSLSPESPTTYIKRLALDFDPEIELKKRPEREKTASEYLDAIRKEIKT